MSEKKDMFRCKKSCWITLILVGVIAILFTIFLILMILQESSKQVPPFLVLLVCIMFLLGLIMLLYGLRMSKHLIVIDEEGIQVYGRSKCPWSKISDLSLDKSRQLIIRYIDPLTLKKRKMKIRPTIYGFQVAAMKIIDKVPDDANVRVSKAVIDTTKSE